MIAVTVGSLLWALLSLWFMYELHVENRRNREAEERRRKIQEQSRRRM